MLLSYNYNKFNSEHKLNSKYPSNINLITELNINLLFIFEYIYYNLLSLLIINYIGQIIIIKIMFIFRNIKVLPIFYNIPISE
jgi:hypothetical protein